MLQPTQEIIVLEAGATETWYQMYLLSSHKLPVRDPRPRCCCIAASSTRLRRACRPRLKISAFQRMPPQLLKKVQTLSSAQRELSD